MVEATNVSSTDLEGDKPQLYGLEKIMFLVTSAQIIVFIEIDIIDTILDD